MPLDAYIAKNLGKKEKTPKTARDKKKWLRDRGIKSVRDPKTGKLSVPVHDKTVMLTGTRLSTKRERTEEHEGRDQAKASFAKGREKMAVSTNTAASCLPSGSAIQPCHMFFTWVTGPDSCTAS